MEIDTKEITVVKQQTSKALTAARDLEITNQEELTSATDLLSKIKSVAKLITEKKTAFTRPAYTAYKQIMQEAKQFFGPHEDACAEAEKLVKTKMLGYQAKVDEEARKQEQQIAKKVEAGRMKFETGAKKMDAIERVETKVEGEKGTIQFRTVREVVIEDEKLIPREYLVPDMTAIKKAALDGAEIPGVKVVERKQIAAR